MSDHNVTGSGGDRKSDSASDDDSARGEHGRVAVGHPIDVASGEFFATHIDHELDGVVPLSFGRLFNTRFLRASTLQTLNAEAPLLPFGPGWRPTWLSELRIALNGFIYTRADGTEFSISGGEGNEAFARTGRMLSPRHGIEIRSVSESQVRVIGYGEDRKRITVVFERYSEDRYRVVALERTREARIDVVYDEYGRPRYLVQRRERRSYELVYAHRERESAIDGARVVEARLHLPDRTSEVVAQYDYDAWGRLIVVRDARGQSCMYEYDEANRVVRDETRGGSVYT